MGALSRPGPQFGTKGPPQARTERELAERTFASWFLLFLKDELRPYQGRLALVLRMTLAATLTMIAIMTFRLPGAAIAAYYTLLLSRESPVSTLRAAGTVMIMYVLGACYTLLSVLLFVDYPVTHFLWVTFSLFACFYVLKVTTNYVGGAAFAFIITIAIPIWDVTAPTALLVVSTLWAAGSVSVGLICTVAVEFLFSGLETKDELVTGLQTRLSALSSFVTAVSTEAPSREAFERKLQQLAMVGVSRLRNLALQAGREQETPERRSTTVSLIGRAVDLAAAFPAQERLRPEEKDTLREVGKRLVDVQQTIRTRQTPGIPAPLAPDPQAHPVVLELARTVELIQLSLAQHAPSAPEPNAAPVPTSIFLSDAWSNPEHLVFSLRGCLAALLCYVILNAIAWRGLSTSIATCVITALSSVGSSRQKQVLRLSGAAVGGLILGIGSQVLILPMLDSLAGFTILFVGVTLIAAWFSTASPRLSYFGLQIALAFYLIHLQEYYPQTNLAIARDRVMGVALGLIMMWLVFDTLGSKPAAQVMRDLFATNLQLLSELARPWQNGQPLDVTRFRQLRDKISQNFGSVNAQGDAVLFEVGPHRQRDLALRDRLLRWQPRLRTLFLLETALLQYRAEVRPSDLNQEIVRAQVAFDDLVSRKLTSLADRFRQRASDSKDGTAEDSYLELKQATESAYGNEPTLRAKGVLAISANIAELLDRLYAEL